MPRIVVISTIAHALTSQEQRSTRLCSPRGVPIPISDAEPQHRMNRRFRMFVRERMLLPHLS